MRHQYLIPLVGVFVQPLSPKIFHGTFRVGSPPYDHAVKLYLYVEAPADVPKPLVASLNPISCSFIHIFLEGWMRSRKKQKCLFLPFKGTLPCSYMHTV